jgi:hypothetical protein
MNTHLASAPSRGKRKGSCARKAPVAWTEFQQDMAEAAIYQCLYGETPGRDEDTDLLYVMVTFIRKAALEGDDTLSRMMTVARRTAESVYVGGAS